MRAVAIACVLCGSAAAAQPCTRELDDSGLGTVPIEKGPTWTRPPRVIPGDDVLALVWPDHALAWNAVTGKSQPFTPVLGDFVVSNGSELVALPQGKRVSLSGGKPRPMTKKNAPRELLAVEMGADGVLAAHDQPGCGVSVYDLKNDAWRELPAPPPNVCTAGAQYTRLVAVGTRVALIRSFYTGAPAAAIFDKGAWRPVTGSEAPPTLPDNLALPGPGGTVLVLGARGSMEHIFAIDLATAQWRDVAPIYAASHGALLDGETLLLNGYSPLVLNLAKRTCVSYPIAHALDHAQLVHTRPDTFVVGSAGLERVVQGAVKARPENVRGVAVVFQHPPPSGVPRLPPEPASLESPLARQSIAVRPGAANSSAAAVATVTTDDKGRFYVQLPPGTYCFVVGGRPAEVGKVSPAARRDCLEQYAKRCDAVATVTSATDPVQVGVSVDSPGPGQMFGACDTTPPPP